MGGPSGTRWAAPFLASYRPAFVWSSDLARARETAEVLMQLLPALELRLDERLREFDVGLREGLTFPEFEQKYPDVYADFMAGREAGLHGAETIPHVCERMTAVLSDAAAAVGVGETGVIVGHGASLRSGLLAFLGVPRSHGEMRAGMANCAWAVLELRGGRGWQIIDYNAQTL